MLTVKTDSPTATIDLGKRLGSLLKKGMVITLQGDLAGGKTTFTKGIGLGLGIKQVINSPTFNILKIYEGRMKLFHIDAYRLKDSDYDLGLYEDLDEGVMVIEWPEYYCEYLPDEYLAISFHYLDDDHREISFVAHGKDYEGVIEKLC